MRGLKSFQIVLFMGILSLYGIIVAFQMTFQDRTSRQPQVELNYLPSGRFLRGMALGYDQALADFIWVRTIGYFGTQLKSDRDFTWLIHMLRLVTELDPMFESPYEFAGVVLPAELEWVDEGMAFLEKGIANIPTHNPRFWLQPFYLGFCYMIYKDDALKAAQYFEMAAKYPQSPPYLPLLATRLYGRAGKPGVGLDIIESVLKAGRKDQQHNYVQRAIEKRIQQLVTAQEIRMLENAVAEYFAVYGQRPSRLEDLVTGMLLPFIPEAPDGGSYFLDMNGRNVQSSRMKESFEIHAEKGGLQVEALQVTP